MAIALLTHKSASNGGGAGSVATTAAIDTTVASLFVLQINSFGTVPSSPSDSQSNSWVLVHAYANGNHNIAIYYALVTATNASHTFSGTGAFPTIYVSTWSGTATSSPQDTFDQGQDSGGNTVTLNSVTPANAGSLVIAGVADNSSNTVSIDGGFTLTDSIRSSSFESGAHYYLIQTSIAAAAPTITFSGGESAQAEIVVFKPAGGGGGFTAKFRKTLSPVGTRVGSRQVQQS